VLYLIPTILLPFLLFRYAFKFDIMPSLAVTFLISPATVYGVVAIAYFVWDISGSGALAMILMTLCLIVGIPIGLILLLMWGPFRFYDKFHRKPSDPPN
jgi:hypothetical protein